MANFQITNEETFNSFVSDVELDLREMTASNCFTGDVAIELVTGQTKVISGDHGENDYEAEFGFKIVSDYKY